MSDFSSFREKYIWPEDGRARLEISPVTQIERKLDSTRLRISRFRLETVYGADCMGLILWIPGSYVTVTARLGDGKPGIRGHQ